MCHHVSPCFRYWQWWFFIARLLPINEIDSSPCLPVMLPSWTGTSPRTWMILAYGNHWIGRHWPFGCFGSVVLSFHLHHSKRHHHCCSWFMGHVMDILDSTWVCNIQIWSSDCSWHCSVAGKEPKTLEKLEWLALDLEAILRTLCSTLKFLGNRIQLHSFDESHHYHRFSTWPWNVVKHCETLKLPTNGWFHDRSPSVPTPAPSSESARLEPVDFLPGISQHVVVICGGLPRFPWTFG